MSGKVNPIPQGYHTVTPYLLVPDAAKAIEFYARALGAEECFRMTDPGGGVMHAEIRVGDSVIMLAGESPQATQKTPEALGGTTVSLLLYVKDVDAAFRRALDAGSTELMPPQNMFWGDRYGKVRDPFGHEWSMATHVEDLTPEQIHKRAREMFAQSQ